MSSPRPPRRTRLALGVGVLTVLATVGCGVQDTPGDAPVTTSDGYSHLDRGGVAQIEQTRRAAFDLRDHTVTRADVGLPDGDLGPVVGGAADPELTVRLVAPEGEEEVRTSTFSIAFNGARDHADYLTWFESYDSAAPAHAALQEAVTRWGFSPADVTRWDQTLELAAGEKVTRSVGLAVSPSGLVVGVDLTATTDGGQTHRYQVQLDPRYYEPGALASIRRTGDLPG